MPGGKPANVCALDLPIHGDAESDVAIVETSGLSLGRFVFGRAISESSRKLQHAAKFQRREEPTGGTRRSWRRDVPKPSSDTTRPRTALIDLPAVAERLGVNERHVRRLVAERRIPFLKWGHLLRFDPDEIDEWLERARVHVRH